MVNLVLSGSVLLNSSFQYAAVHCHMQGSLRVCPPRVPPGWFLSRRLSHWWPSLKEFMFTPRHEKRHIRFNHLTILMM